MAREFDGVTQYGTATRAFTGNAFTFGCWLYVQNTSAWSCVIGSRNGGIGIQQQGIAYNSDTERLIYSWENTSDEYEGAGLIPPKLAWFLAALVISPTAATLYVGSAGGPLRSWTNTKTHNSKSPSSWEFMNDTILANRLLDGYMMNAFMYNTSLNSLQITDLMNWTSPLVVARTNLISFWPMTGSVSPEPDIINGASMTLTGSPPSVNNPSLHFRGLPRSAGVNIK